MNNIKKALTVGALTTLTGLAIYAGMSANKPEVKAYPDQIIANHNDVALLYNGKRPAVLAIGEMDEHTGRFVKSLQVSVDSLIHEDEPLIYPISSGDYDFSFEDLKRIYEAAHNNNYDSEGQLQ